MKDLYSRIVLGASVRKGVDDGVTVNNEFIDWQYPRRLNGYILLSSKPLQPLRFGHVVKESPPGRSMEYSSNINYCKQLNSKLSLLIPSRLITLISKPGHFHSFPIIRIRGRDPIAHSIVEARPGGKHHLLLTGSATDADASPPAAN